MAIILVAVVINFVLQENRQQTLEHMRDNLTITQGTMQRIDTWFNEHSQFLQQLTQNPERADTINQLLAIASDTGHLGISEAQTTSHTYLLNLTNKLDHADFQIINR